MSFAARCRPKTRLAVLSLFLILLPVFQSPSLAQNQNENQDQRSREIFHLERLPVAGGAELITIQARLDGLGTPNSTPQWVPLVSVLRDTLGDANNENDRLRYLWALTYTRPTFWQRMAGAVPFLYTRVGNKQDSKHDPPPLMDLSAAGRVVWDRVCWNALQSILLDPYGTPLRASTRSYRRNVTDFRKGHVIRALALLSLYQELGNEPIFSSGEFQEIQARLLLTDKTFGGLVDDLNLQSFYQKETTSVKDARGHNWEILRQQAETNGLYFEPLEMPDGSTTHALLWIAKPELKTREPARFEGRFLNLANPWTDKRLSNWGGYVETRFFDADSRPTTPDTPGARAVDMIPLALYGLDHPKIPVLLVDFRDSRNPKHREMSRRVLQDVTRNVLAISRFGDLPYFLGRSVFDFVTGRRGMDINQPSRLRTYSQLKLLLSLTNSLEPELRAEISDRLDHVSLNPLENSLEAESRLAREQYEALRAYALRPDGLPEKLERDRRSEMVMLEHGRSARFVFSLANVLSLGRYAHREESSADIPLRLDIARQLAYHTRFLREVSQSGVPSGAASQGEESSPRIDVLWSLDKVKQSLRFVAEHGSDNGSRTDAKAVVATARIFARTEDLETRRACLEALSQINNAKARAELLRISESKQLDQGLRDLIAQSLSKPARPVEVGTATGSATNSGGPDH